MSTAEDAMVDYYAQRASEYESVYAKPERQADLQTMGQFLSRAFPGDRLLEVACGTGYWTQCVAKSAARILATDCNAEVIDLARRKDFGACRVEFAEADAYLLDGIRGGHTAGFHGFWWSHVSAAKIDAFLSVFHTRLSRGAKVVMIDNAYVEGSSTPICRRDSEGNTYQVRRLQDGSEHEVLKNFPSERDLRESLSAHAADITVRFLEYFWIVEYRTREDAE
jgi:demethylmenaquinone methyltransferase/2-methoxy-6-polyprenyl-1,4-benzoquinol methylase